MEKGVKQLSDIPLHRLWMITNHTQVIVIYVSWFMIVSKPLQALSTILACFTAYKEKWGTLKFSIKSNTTSKARKEKENSSFFLNLPFSNVHHGGKMSKSFITATRFEVWIPKDLRSSTQCKCKFSPICSCFNLSLYFFPDSGSISKYLQFLVSGSNFESTLWSRCS